MSRARGEINTNRKTLHTARVYAKRLGEYAANSMSCRMSSFTSSSFSYSTATGPAKFCHVTRNPDARVPKKALRLLQIARDLLHL